MNRDEILNLAYRVREANNHKSVYVRTKYGKFKVLDWKGRPVERGIKRVVKTTNKKNRGNNND